MSNTYEPLDQEDFEAASPAPAAVAGKRRKRRGAAKGRSGAAIVGIVVLVILGLAIVACAIALPIVFTRQTQQNANRNANLAFNRKAQSGGAGWAAPPAGAVSSMANAGELLPVAGGGSAGVPDGVAEANVGPDVNLGGNVYCYMDKDQNAMPGAFTLTGEKSSEDGLERSEVRSCGSGSKLFLLTSRLSLCKAECKEPAWMAIAQGMVNAPIWTQQYVCAGDQVYLNKQTPRFTFYWRYAGYVQEQLITKCESTDAFWVPNIQLRFCQPKEITSCQLQNMSPTAQGAPKILEGVPAGSSSVPRAVCRHTLNDNKLSPFFATGVAANSWSWSHFAFLDKVEVTPCTNRNGEKTWFPIDELVPCPEEIGTKCTAGQA